MPYRPMPEYQTGPMVAASCSARALKIGLSTSISAVRGASAIAHSSTPSAVWHTAPRAA